MEQVQEAKLLILELNREEALAKVHAAMVDEEFDPLLRTVQVSRHEPSTPHIYLWT